MTREEIYQSATDLIANIHRQKQLLNQNLSDRTHLIQQMHQIEVPLKKGIEQDKQYSNADKRKTRLDELLAADENYQSLQVQLKALDDSAFTLRNDCEMWDRLVRLNIAYLGGAAE